VADNPSHTPLVDPRPLLRASAWHLAAWLAVVAVLCSVDVHRALSVLLGAAIAIVPAAVMARAVFRFRDRIAPRDYARAVYRGELGKFLLTIMLFAAVFAEVQWVEPAGLLVAFVAALVLQWLLAARYLLKH
jgi:ATP synthase protein I